MANPTAREQELLELINRMRLAPAAELDLLLNSSDPDIKIALDYFKVDQNILRSQWSKLKAVAPLAWSSQLNDSAAAHNQVMIANDQQSHHIVGKELDLAGRLTQAGYNYTSGRENIYAYATSIIYAHAGFAIDWGDDIGGIQNPAGHREAMMATNIREVGLSVIEENNPNTKVGPLVVTQDFGNRAALNGKGWLLGVAFQDFDKDGWYDAGEGLNDVDVKITGINGTSFTKTIDVAEAGGYQELLNPGQYQVDFLRNGKVVGTKTTSIDSLDPNNVKLDLVLPLLVLGEDPLSEIPTEIPVNLSPVNTTPVDTTSLAKSGLPLGTNSQQTNHPEVKVFDFRTDATDNSQVVDLTNRTIDVKFVGVSAEAVYHNFGGLYRVEDINGTVMDTNGILYRPNGDIVDQNGNILSTTNNPYAYLEAALRRSKETRDGTQLDRADLKGDTTLRGGYIYAPFVVVNGKVDDVLNSTDPAKTPNVFFNYKAANADGIEHFKLLGDNKLGVEDIFGGGDLDFNDLIFQVSARVV